VPVPGRISAHTFHHLPFSPFLPVRAHHACQIFTDILGYTTHKHKIAPSSDLSPSSFVPSIFCSVYQGAPHGSSSKMRAKRSRSHPTSGSHRRQASEPNASSSDTSPTTPRERLDVRSRPPRRLPFHATTARSDSSALIESEGPHSQRTPGNPWLPSALVLTGLEHSSAPCHRALLRALLENRVAFGEDLHGAKPSFEEFPEDFIVVYVCPFDPRERPSIHKSLVRHTPMALSLPTNLTKRPRSSTSSR